MKEKQKRILQSIQVRSVLYIGIFALCLALAMLIGQQDETAAQAAAGTLELPIYSVERSNKVVSLTFDAAWGNEDTQELIDILGRYNIRATFFIVGEWVDKYPESVKALADAGHEVMNHSNTHPHMTQLSKEQMIAEVCACDDKIEAITGIRPILFRPPYGDYNNTVIEAMRESGHYTIQWDVDSLDWKEISAGEILERVLSKAREGSIILFHNAAKHTPEALAGIIEGLMQEGYSFLPVSELIYREGFTMNHEGRQIKNSTPTVT